MAYKIGSAGLAVLLGKETTPGTEASSIAKKLGYAPSITPKVELEMIKGQSAFSQDIRYTKHVRKSPAFEVEFDVLDWWWLYAIMGGHSVSGTGPYTHTLTLANKLPSYSIEAISDDLGESFKFLGSKMDEMELSIAEGSPVKAKTSWKAMDFIKDTTPQSAAEGTGDPWMADEVTILTVNGVSRIEHHMDLTLKLSRNLLYGRTGGQSAPRFIAENRREWEIEAELYQVDNTLFDLLTNSTEFQFQVKLVKGSDSITMTWPKCQLEAVDYSWQGDNPLSESMKVVPYAQSGDTIVTITTVDTIADYTT